MDFSLTDTQLEFRDRARAVAEKLAPDYQARERAGRIEPELRREIGAAGLIAPEIPVALGGQGADRLTSGLVTEEIGRGDINVAYLQVVGSLVGQIVAANAAPEVAAHWVPKICSGEEIVGIGLTEPHRRLRRGHAPPHGRPRRGRLGPGRQQVAVVRPRRRRRGGGRPHRAVGTPRQGHQCVPRAARPAGGHPRAGARHGHQGRWQGPGPHGRRCPSSSACAMYWACRSATAPRRS